MATFKTINDAIKAVIKVELAEEGYLEKASNKKLYSKTENAGDANYTKYWRDLAKLGLMGQGENFSGGPAWYWCAGFQTWSFIQVFGKDMAKKLLLHLPYISCANLGALALKKNQLYSTPKVGDIVLFYNGTRFSHTGYVIEVKKTQIKTVEGNTNNSKSVVPNGGAVCVKTYAISTCKNKGHKFFRPDYSLAVKTTSTTKKPTTTTTKKPVITKKEAVINTISPSLRCRKKPNSSGVIIGSFKKGSVVEVLEKTSSSWWKVTGKDTSGKKITGYSASQYLKEK